MTRLQYILCAGLIIGCVPHARSQTVAPVHEDTTQQNEGKILEILKADHYNYLKKDSSNQFISLAKQESQVVLRQGKTLFYADSAVINTALNIMEAFGNIHINDADSVHTYSQYLKYLGKEKKAFLKKKVKLTDNKSVITTDEMEYDVTLKIGTYLKGGKVVTNKTTVVTSNEGYYYGDTKEVFFKKKVVLTDTSYKIITDSLQYNTTTQMATVTGPSTIYNEKRIIRTHEAYFDLKNKKGTLYRRSVVDDSTYTLTADEMAFDDSTGLGQAHGNAVFRGKDTAQGADLIANSLWVNKKKNSLLAVEKPLLIIKQGKDSVFITADTLYSARLSDLQKTRPVPFVRDTGSRFTDNKKDSSTDKYFEAYYHVKIFSDSLQATGDSLFYSLQDSVFRLFKQPVMWAKENQVTGDTIYLFVKNKKPERMYAFENAMALSKVDSSNYFNQVKGNTLNALFLDGKINFMRVKGYAENVYYGLDDNQKFIGVTKNNSDVIEVHFGDSKPKKVVFVNKLEGTSYPMQQVNHNELRLRGFKWLEDIRPKSRYDILN